MKGRLVIRCDHKELHCAEGLAALIGRLPSPMRAAEIRRAFIDYFRLKAGHTFAPSSPVVPFDDPTLLFTNAGMNQFKDVFLGRGTRPYTRAVNSQKCIRAGGKHNDLEDVGKDSYHHTFFEMLGNWSFGDYFKKESIAWGWELLTKDLGLPADRIYATYFGGNERAGLAPDDEAKALWLQVLPPNRVIPGSMKDNFWEMGETGPCGPCSEIHFDRIGGRDAAKLVNSGDPDVLEIWNHVFIQFNREPDASLKLLPAKHVDTGMGLERLVSVIQDKRSNYDTDLWSPILDAIRHETGARAYAGKLEDHTDIAYRVIADHIRCLTVAACDGAGPGADGRSYVLRRILRRAARHGRQTLGRQDAFLYRLVPAVVETLGDAFPEIRERADRAVDIIRDEEIAFGRTIDRGLALFEEAASRAVLVDGTKRVSGEDAFKLHDTMGFPIDLTQVMAEERGFRVDLADYEVRMETARELSRGKTGGAEAMHFPPDAIAALQGKSIAPTKDAAKYSASSATSAIRALWTGDRFVEALAVGERGAVILDATCFYAESGGQVGDTGTILCGANEFAVTDTHTFGGYVLHIGRVSKGTISVGASGYLAIDAARRANIAANHTGTHLVNLALREVAASEVEQRGSLVAPERLRFDYTARGPLTLEQIGAVESAVAKRIAAGLDVHAVESPLEAARQVKGVRAVFGERYPDPVRVVSIGPSVSDLLAAPSNDRWMEASVEFCGGTHVANTREIGQFVIEGESALSAGIRRVMAVTGPAAAAAVKAAADLDARIAAAMALEGEALKTESTEITKLETTLPLGVRARAALQPKLDALRERLKEARKASEGANRADALTQARAAIEAHASSADPSAPLVFEVVGADGQALLAVIDSARARLPSTPILLASADHEGGKVAIVASCPKAAIDRGLKAGDWARTAAQACGGKGGGKPDLAQAGGKDPTKVKDALDAALAFASAQSPRT